uniref:Uncharacterized protein n=1 Tax=Ciona intestinalis TaxID=7719 RepID=F6UJ38_CIOIN
MTIQSAKHKCFSKVQIKIYKKIIESPAMLAVPPFLVLFQFFVDIAYSSLLQCTVVKIKTILKLL